VSDGLLTLARTNRVCLWQGSSVLQEGTMRKSSIKKMYGWVFLFLFGSLAYPIFTVDEFWIGGQVAYSLIIAVYLLVFKIVLWLIYEDPTENDWLPAAYPIGIGITILTLIRLTEPCGLLTNLLSGKIRC
jgi:hypothetical protein